MRQPAAVVGSSLIQRFVRWNKELSKGLDSFLGIPWVSIREEEQRLIESLLPSPSMVVADVGGGKKPYFPSRDPRIDQYVGLDIDQNELDQAPSGSYDSIRAQDITRPDSDLEGKFDLIICKNTLEHVADAEAAIAGLSQMLKPGGRCYLAAPCRLAPFAILNRWVPERLKRAMLFRFLPEKAGDGFVARYDRCTPSEFRSIIKARNAIVFYEKRFFWSSYFSIFLPAYIVWRLVSALAKRLSPDYCERFHMAFERPRHA